MIFGIISNNIINYIFNIVFIFDIIKLFCFSSILLSLKSNSSNFSNWTFSNILISDILFFEKPNPFNSLKFTFCNISILDILLQSKYNFSNFSNWTFSNILLSDILL